MSHAIVVGAGIMGLCTAWGLVRRGWRVTVLEQGPIPNPLASSAGQHRLIRHPYGDSVGYTTMIPRAFDAWDMLWADLGVRHFHRTGTLAFGTGAATGWTERSLATLKVLGVPGVEQLDRGALTERFPWLRFEAVTGGFFMESGGALLCGAIVADLARWLVGQGADVRPHTAVTAVDLAAGTVIAAGEELRADHVIVAAGPWSARLLPDLAARVKPSRQVLALVDPPADLAGTWASAPMILDVGTAGFYAVPPVAGTQLKIGDHSFSLQGDPDRDREAREAEVRAVYDCASSRFARFDEYTLAGSRTCFYTVEPDERFIVEQRGAAWILAGFSGHGFKFGALLGLEVAAAASGERDPARLARWAAGQG